jgi:hypothetical protein
VVRAPGEAEVRIRFPAVPDFLKLVSLERGPLSLVSTTEELIDRNVAAPVYKTENTAVGSVTLTTWHPLSAKGGANFADKHRPQRYSKYFHENFVITLIVIDQRMYISRSRYF